MWVVLTSSAQGGNYGHWVIIFLKLELINNFEMDRNKKARAERLWHFTQVK
jgi:hypothetical protein